MKKSGAKVKKCRRNDANSNKKYNFAAMKKFFILAAILVVTFNVYCHLAHPEDNRTPYTEFRDRIGIAPMKEYRDSCFGYCVKYPYFFRKEEDTKGDFLGHARFSYTQNVNIVLESYVTRDLSPSLRSCADSLALRLHAERRILASAGSKTSGDKREDSSFILYGPVYENNVRIDGYSHYDKFIKSGRMLFVYSLTYPNNYEHGLTRLFNLVKDWKVLGAGG